MFNSFRLQRQIENPRDDLVQFGLLAIGRLGAVDAVKLHVAGGKVRRRHGLGRLKRERLSDVQRIGLQNDAVKVERVRLEVDQKLGVLLLHLSAQRIAVFEFQHFAAELVRRLVEVHDVGEQVEHLGDIRQLSDIKVHLALVRLQGADDLIKLAALLLFQVK